MINLPYFISLTVTIIFFLITTVFAIKYSKLLVLARNEYVKAKDIIRIIVLTFKKQQEEKVNQLDLKIRSSHSDIKKLTKRFHTIENQTTSTTYNEIIDQINSVQKNIDFISKNQQHLQNQLFALKKMQIIDKEKTGLSLVNDTKQFKRLTLTGTEYDILQLLMKEGAKTSSEVEKAIKKTREHTARLMKKLWQEGYVERDTHRIPYIHRITKNFQKNIKELEKKT